MIFVQNNIPLSRKISNNIEIQSLEYLDHNHNTKGHKALNHHKNAGDAPNDEKSHPLECCRYLFLSTS